MSPSSTQHVLHKALTQNTRTEGCPSCELSLGSSQNHEQKRKAVSTVSKQQYKDI